MTSAFSRISENMLFSVLLAAVVGWTVVSVADAATPAADSVACTVAKIAAGISHS
jgi:hypothetical protein